MPVMDGVEAAARIRQLPSPACDVPVIALSANVMAEDLARYNAAGMNGALTKPIDWPKLFAALAQHGSAGRMEAAPLADLALSSVEPVEISGAPEAEVPGQVNLGGFDHQPKAKLAELFVRDAGQCLEELRDAVQRADLPAIARLAHAIRGTAANFGAQHLAQICADIEARAKAAELDATSGWLDGLQHEFARICAALAADRNPSDGGVV